ncbi:MAG: glycosyl transferase family 2 [Bacteroidetes bacterium MedPE-SWsnd-G2]|nr:MAG: glycosyl transferase family 2 [Bacteroidetes bacterium MedPE-SWsnd-G2]
MSTPLISIIIPFKNTGKYLEVCLQSIITQTHKNWELLIVDDNSSDNSFEIVNQFAQTDHRITLLKSKGTGIIDALQTGYAMAKGEFITRMDSDDRMEHDKLKTMISQLLEYGTGHIALGLVSYFSENGVGNGFMEYETWLNQLTSEGKNFQSIYKECVIPSPCWMVHKTDFDACGGFNSNIYPEDYDLAFRFYKHNYKCIPCNQVLHYWRDYGERASRNDSNYSKNSLLDIKLKYFIALELNTAIPLVLWGAGQKGKRMAQQLIDQNIEFNWICDNPKKIGKDIYGKKLLPFNQLKQLENPQSIITVANKTAQQEIRLYLQSLGKKEMEDYYFFC